MGLFVLLALVTLIITVYNLLHKHKRKNASSTASLPLPPGPAGFPVIGSALHFIGPFSRSPHAVLSRLAKTYSPIMSFLPGTAAGNFVVVSSPDAAREALVENDAALAARFVPDVARAVAHSSESLFFLPNSSPLWRQHRAMVGAHMASGQSLGVTRHVRDRHARRLAESVRARSGMPFNVGDTVLGTVIDVVSNMLFSEDVADRHVLQSGQLFKDLMVGLLQDWTKPNVSDAFPFLAPIDLLGSRRRVSGALTKLYKFFDDEFVERRLANYDDENHGDLLDVVLARHAKSELTRSEIKKFFTDIFLAAKQDQAAAFRGFDFTYKPFGAGRRVCPGSDFATRLVPLLLASILHRTDWSLPSGMAVDLKDLYSMVLELAKPLHAVPVSAP